MEGPIFHPDDNHKVEGVTAWVCYIYICPTYPFALKEYCRGDEWEASQNPTNHLKVQLKRWQ